MPEPPVDLAILGGGLSGSLTLLAVSQTEWFHTHRIVVVDRMPQPLAGRRWGYWGVAEIVPGVDSGRWARLVVHGPEQLVDVPLRRQRYRRLAGELLAAVVDRAVGNHVARITDGVVGVGDDGAGVRVALASGRQLRTRFVLDSTRRLLAPPGSPTLQFLGYRLPPGSLAPQGADTVTLMDLRVPQCGGVRFVYVVPETDGTLVELTSFQPRGEPEDLAVPLRQWLDGNAAGGAAAAVPQESGRYPLRRRGRRRLSPSVMLIGLGGGSIRASTGYGVAVMAADAGAIAATLDSRGYPFPRRPVGPVPRWLDEVFLAAMATDPAAVRTSYPAMFAGGRGDSVLEFLDGTVSVRDALAVVGAMPRAPFTIAAGRHVLAAARSRR